MWLRICPGGQGHWWGQNEQYTKKLAHWEYHTVSEKIIATHHIMLGTAVSSEVETSHHKVGCWFLKAIFVIMVKKNLKKFQKKSKKFQKISKKSRTVH